MASDTIANIPHQNNAHQICMQSPFNTPDRAIWLAPTQTKHHRPGAFVTAQDGRGHGYDHSCRPARRFPGHRDRTRTSKNLTTVFPNSTGGHCPSLWRVRITWPSVVIRWPLALCETDDAAGCVVACLARSNCDSSIVLGYRQVSSRVAPTTWACALSE